MFNMNRTKEMLVDFRKSRNKSSTISILGEEVKGWRTIDTLEFTWTAD